MILSDPFSQDEFIQFIKGFLPDFNLDIRKVDVGSSGFSDVLRLGESSSLLTSVLIVRSKKNINSRISLTNNSFKILKTYSIYRALVVYINDDDTIWRLSLLTATPTLSQDGKILLTLSNPRRHSYVLGTEVGVATARKYLSTKGRVQDFTDLEYRFSVEAVNKDFYSEIAEHFYKLVGKYGSNREVLQKPVLKLPDKRAAIEDLQNYSVRLLGRIIFLWFLRQKMSTNGNSLLPTELLSFEGEDSKAFLHHKVEPLFFEILNKQIPVRNEKYKQGLFGQVPYLNGGLFHASEGLAGDYYNPQNQSSEVEIPDDWFQALFNTLNTYNFTIDENLENDVDLSIDPEMLGRVFENLLAEINPETGQVARKSTGSYYTPRAIVNYMVDETLKEYLLTKTTVDELKLKAVISVSRQDDSEFPLTPDDRSEIVQAILDLKALDPACGSGAFPIGMLQKLLWLLCEVDPTGIEYLESSDMEGTEHWLTPSRLDYLRKRKIIRDVIFGSDIQSVAIEIAKLRCFLTLIVDQEIDDDSPNRGVVPLPNLDFKFICADSLTPLDENKQRILGDDPELESKLMEIRKKYFTTTDETKKAKLCDNYEKLANSSPTLFGESKRNQQIKSFKPLTNNSQALFFDPKYMFGVEKFNIIISNPPYVDYRKITPNTKSELLVYAVSKVSKMINLYIYFFEMGFNFLKNDGILAYISPQQYLVYPNTKGLRDLIREKSILLLADFARVKIFGAATYTFVSIISNKKDLKNGIYKEFSEMDNFENPLREMIIANPIPEPLNFSNHKLLIDKIVLQSNGSLGESSEIFCASSSTSLVTSSDPKLGPKFLEASNIFEWKIKNVTKYVDEKTYSSNSAQKQKLKCIVTSRMTKTIRASIIENKEYLGGKINVIIPHDDNFMFFYLALLNSKLINFWYREKFSLQHMQGGALPINTTELCLVPIPNLEKKLLDRISTLSRKLLEGNVEDLRESHIELDNLVFKSFQLSSDEIETVLRKYETY